MVHSRKLRPDSSSLLAAIALIGMLAALSVWSGDHRPAASQSPPSSNLPPTAPDEVAQEIAEIQQRLGGSIVPDTFSSFVGPGELATILPATADLPIPVSLSTTSPSRVVILRRSARELDEMAHRFEVVEMFGQADALRSLAAELREDAR